MPGFASRPDPASPDRSCPPSESRAAEHADRDRPVVLRWSRHPSCVGLARLELRKALAGWGLAALEESATLVLSELLTNAGRHARVSPGRQIETRYVPALPSGLRIEVHDASPVRPEPRAPDPDACGGRGLLLVAALADSWGIGDRDGPGKVVWAHLSLPPREGDGPL
ncbi:ATP-binding protein [Streptomyces xinghaiensis]|uniref:ATP-binding protein n=1 Tax=Streptomyces xinghaiensis TaxID=1038928 RepID=A0A3M8FEN4_9ACTN|nr:ATP-binding protein [Streptomyces xinghaiensis]RKM98821.1 ATP-binding protein [Streptomyces xinghaiensis]RNC76278.1 ATP-binding protein [Streptomyces xinghaiensis]